MALPSMMSATRQSAAIRGSMRTADPPTSTIAAVIGATFRLGRTAAANDRIRMAAERINPSSRMVWAFR